MPRMSNIAFKTGTLPVTYEIILGAATASLRCTGTGRKPQKLSVIARF